MPRFKNDSSVTMFIDSRDYRGDDRRETTRHRIHVPAELEFRERNEVVRVHNLSYGGCAYHGTLLVNTQATVSMQFFKKIEDGKYVQCVPIHGRVIHVHKREHSQGYSVCIDFKGILFQEHGIEAIIEDHLESERRKELERIMEPNQ